MVGSRAIKNEIAKALQKVSGGIKFQPSSSYSGYKFEVIDTLIFGDETWAISLEGFLDKSFITHMSGDASIIVPEDKVKALLAEAKKTLGDDIFNSR